MIQSAFGHLWIKLVYCFLCFVEQVERGTTQNSLREGFQKPPRTPFFHSNLFQNLVIAGNHQMSGFPA